MDRSIDNLSLFTSNFNFVLVQFAESLKYIDNIFQSLLNFEAISQKKGIKLMYQTTDSNTIQFQLTLECSVVVGLNKLAELKKKR